MWGFPIAAWTRTWPVLWIKSFLDQTPAPAPIPADEPFRIMVREGVVRVDHFSYDMWRHYAGTERELPVLRDAIRQLVEDGELRFVFDLRRADESSAYPIVKWGAMYGAVFGLRTRCPGTPSRELTRHVKLVGDRKRLVEIKHVFQDFFEAFDTLEGALEAVRAVESDP